MVFCVGFYLFLWAAIDQKYCTFTTNSGTLNVRIIMEGKIMSGISSVAGGTDLSSAALQTEFSARVASLQKDVQALQGDLALQLIQCASLDAGTGHQLDVAG
jgi:hypothetical protein